jgi:hypothetical protein
VTTSMSESPRRQRAFLRPARSARAERAAGDVRESHGGRRLATGVTIAAGFIILAHLMHAVALAPYLPPGLGPWPAWFALAAVVGVGVGSRFATRTLPDWLYVVLLVGLVVPVWLDVSATAGLIGLGITPTAAAAAGAVLMPVAAIRGTRVPLLAGSAIAVVLAVEALLQVGASGRDVVAGVAVAITAVFPLVLVALATDGFRRLVGRELDLSLVQSTVATSRSAVGMRASEELAQLDFDAETLLDDVGSGRIAIPLPADTAERAGSLAARLRVRLIEGRTDTWLRHAVTESAYLSDQVTVDDPMGSAGLLSQAQRDGLLLALWLLVAEHPKGANAPVRVHLVFRETSDDASPDVAFGLSIDVSGVARRRVDPATWDAIGSVGEHNVVTRTDGFTVDVSCRVAHSARPGGPQPRGAARSRGN